MKFKTAYDPVEEHDHCGIEFTMPSLAVQDEKDETDINYIVNKYELVSGVREEFYSLPAYVRAKFGHDPMNFINQLNDPATLEYLQQQGLYGSEYTFDEPQQSVSNKQTQEKNNTLEQNNEETQK